MNDIKEKSAVGTAIPATESDNNTTESIIDISEKIKSYSENITDFIDYLETKTESKETDK